MGNICRSPAAEGVMKSLIKNEGLEERIVVDSAGTIGNHAGDLADARMRQHSKLRGIELLSRSRAFIDSSDFNEFDYIVVMDDHNYEDIMGRDGALKYKKKIHMMTDFCTKFDDSFVPDPYYGGDQGFEHVLDLVEDGCYGLLEQLKKEL